MAQTEAQDIAPEVVANLRLRLERGDGLCLNEHTINQADESIHGRKRMWITCGQDRQRRVDVGAATERRSDAVG